MSLNFPLSPVVGQLFPSPAVPGMPQYVWDGTAWNTGPVNNVGRSFLHNGLFNVQQRGQGPWTVNSWTADRWSMFYNASQTMSTSIIALTDANRASIGDEAAVSALRAVFTGNATAGSWIGMEHHIEGIRRLAGKTVTVSFWAFAASGAPKLGMSIDQNFGSGGSPSAYVPGVGQSVTISTTPTRYSLTFNIASASGKTLGTNNNDFTDLVLWFSGEASNNSYTGSVGVQSGTFTLWGIQLELGSTATTLEKLDPQADLANCQRFYQTGRFNFGAVGSAGVNCEHEQTLPVTMRATPTLTTSGVAVQGGTANITTFPSSINVGLLNTSTGGIWYIGNYTLSADL
jgi:hypothetical protein